VTVTDVALVAVTVSVEVALLPPWRVVGFAEIVTVGKGTTVTVAVAVTVPPNPVAVAV
jgi:hypothetical protein